MVGIKEVGGRSDIGQSFFNIQRIGLLYLQLQITRVFFILHWLARPEQ